MNVNKVILAGNLTRDPQLSYLPSQMAVMEFGIAINRKFKKQDGSIGEEVCFVDCQMFGKRAEAVNQYFKKGSPIYIEGRLKFEQWQAQDGTNRSRMRVLAEEFQFVGSNQNQQNGQSGQSQGQQRQAPPQSGYPQGTPAGAPPQQPSYGQPPNGNPQYSQNYIPPEDDIPF